MVASYLGVHLLVWEEDELLVLDDSPTQLQVAVQLGGLVGTGKGA